jgi:bla regulator protein BlaR1
MRKQLLLTAGFAALACIAASGQDKAKPAFEVASIKPAKPGQRGMRVEFDPGGRFVASNMSLRFLIQQAYGIKDFQIVGAPAWAGSEHYDIVAKPESGVELGRDSLRPMMEALLVERFKLVVHRETKELPIYSLVVAKSGSKLKESAGEQGRVMQRFGRGEVNLEGATMVMLVTMLAQQLGRNVIDNTGLTGHYDIKLQWTPDESLRGPGDGGGPPPPESAAPPDNSGPSLFTAVQEQLGLKLESSKGPVEIVVIDHVEKATEN